MAAQTPGNDLGFPAEIRHVVPPRPRIPAGNRSLHSFSLPGFLLYRVRDRRDRRKVFIRVRPHSLEPLIPKYEGIGKAYMSLAERYDNKGLELICDYLERASEVSKRKLANMIAGNGSRSTQLEIDAVAQPSRELQLIGRLAGTLGALV